MNEHTTKLPSDAFDLLLSRLIGLPNGAHVQPTVVQAVDFYGNTTSYMVQTVKTDEGPTVFITQVNASGSARFIIPPDVLRVIDRQRDATLTMIRRRHGQRLAETSGGRVGGFTPEMRAKALATRKARAEAKRARKAGRSATKR